MVSKHIQKSLDEGGVLAKDVKIKYLDHRSTDYAGIEGLDYENPENKAFYSAAYVLMDGVNKEIVTHGKQRIGGFNIYPVGFNQQNVKFKPRVFSGQYRMGFSNFELSATMLSEPVISKLSKLYSLIRADVESEVIQNFEDSTMVLHRTTWEPPHFHVQDKGAQNNIDSVSYAVRICGKGENSSVFDFFSDSFDVSEGLHNPITKIYFKGKYIHQVYKKVLSDENMYFFFVWDGCQFKKPMDLEKSVYVQRWYNKSL